MDNDKILQLYQQERDKRSQELFNKNESELSLEEIMILEEYLNNLRNPEWKAIYINDIKTNYEINNVGYLRNIKTGKFLYGTKNDLGYIKLSIRLNRRNVYCKIHRLVALAFIPNPENKREVNHKNCKKDCNWVNNLEWATSSENKLHARENGLYDYSDFMNSGTNSPVNVYSEEQVRSVCKLLEAGFGPKYISEKLNISIYLPNAIKYYGKWNSISSEYKIPLYKKYNKHVNR